MNEGHQITNFNKVFVKLPLGINHYGNTERDQFILKGFAKCYHKGKNIKEFKNYESFSSLNAIL